MQNNGRVYRTIDKRFPVHFHIFWKIGTPGVHVSTARESKMCYSLGTSVGDVTRCKRCAIFVVYIADLEIFDCRYFCWRLWGNVELAVKGRALPYITNEGGSIRTYLQKLELNINDSVRKYYNSSDYLTGSRSNSNNIITKNTYKWTNINPLFKYNLSRDLQKQHRNLTRILRTFSWQIINPTSSLIP